MARRLGILIATLAALLLAVGAYAAPSAHADPKNPKCPNPAGKYPPGQCKFAENKSHGNRGDTVVVFGSGYSPRCAVIVYFAKTRVGDYPTNKQGQFVGKYTVPIKGANGQTMPDGNHLVTAVDRCGDHFAQNVTFHVDGGPTSATVKGANFSNLPHTGPFSDPFGNLPHTGTVLIPMTAVGAALVFGGGSMMVAGRRRRSGSAA